MQIDPDQNHRIYISKPVAIEELKHAFARRPKPDGGKNRTERL
jgi:hypothetical protein